MTDRTQYFRKFPLVIYNDNPAVNITRRVDFQNYAQKFFTAFYEYEIPAGERIETLAHDYYNDVDLDWLIYLANDMVDPYHGIALNYEDFEKSIIKKYGSVRAAQRKTFLYRNNYRGDISQLSVDGYNALIGARKKYWNPVNNAYGIVGYERNDDEIYASTNRIISYSFTAEIGNAFTSGEIVDFVSGSKSGSATVASSNTTSITLQHIEGDWGNVSIDFDITGDESSITANLDSTSYTLLKHVIPEVEQIYFSSYSYYDYEEDLNEKKRKIYLVDENYADKLNRQLDDLMK